MFGETVAQKECTACNRTQPATLDYFSPQARGRYGLHSQCRECRRAYGARRYRKDHSHVLDIVRRSREKNREATRGRARANCAALSAANADASLPSGQFRACPRCQRVKPLTFSYWMKERARKNGHSVYCKTCMRRQLTEWRRRQKAMAKAQWRNARARRRQCPERMMHHAIGVAMRAHLGRAKNGKSWPGILGYDAATLCRHLERQFHGGMSWANYGSHWHIDHIIPIASFVISPDEDNFTACWALTNLRPLAAKENLQKGGRRTLLL